MRIGTGSVAGSRLDRGNARMFPAALKRSAIILLLVAGSGCDRTPERVPVDSPTVTVPARPDTQGAVPARPVWDPALGPVLLIASNAPDTAGVIFPAFSDSTLTDTTTFDTSTLSGFTVDLFSRAGRVGAGRVRGTRAPSRQGCVAWPEASLTITDARPVDAAWTVAFAAGRATALVLDSLETLAGADSARLTAEAARLASLVPADTSTAFHGIPFFVRQVRRFRIGVATDVLVANITRRINQEANPREEQLFFIAERDGSRPDSRYALVYHERVSGQEEAIETTDVLAAVVLAPGATPALVLLRDYGDGSAYALLTRSAAGEWHIAWSSAYTGC
jgi:hypothetical protein